MPTQLLFYKRATAVSSERHGDWSVDHESKFDFASEINSVPLTAVEILNAAQEYAVVFAGTDEAVVPVVLLGIEDHQNLYLAGDGTWAANYIPAFVRRYPFVFSQDADDESRFTLCIDESWNGCNQEGRGERLFDETGERSTYLDNVLGFLKEYQSHFQRSQAFCSKLQELDLLEPMQAQFNLGDGESRSLTGFTAVSRDKLKALTAKQLHELAQTDELELIYNHLQSLNNVSLMLERAGKKSGPTNDAPDDSKAKSEPAKQKSEPAKKS
jgi:hypothetical protein